MDETPKKIDPSKDRVSIPVTFIPGFRTTIAIQNGVENNLLFRTWGGLGDQICSEPTLRFALKSFQGCQISLASEKPELFSHLNFNRVFDLRREQPIYGQYLLFDTITPPDDSNLVWQFFGHMTTHCVDFPSLCALRSQLPVSDRSVKLIPAEPDYDSHLRELPFAKAVFIHPGRHWPSKTFPADWWNTVIETVAKSGLVPILIGADTDDNRGTVDVNTQGCIDLRNELSVSESIWCLKSARALLTNDSAPLHMAASGPAWIGFIATCKHPDLITHWRNGEWGWRMENHGLGGIWDVIDYCPNKENEVKADFVDPCLLKSWLPEPEDFADWAALKVLS